MNRDHRCKNCRKLLFKYKNNARINIEIKCPRCGIINEVKFEGNEDDLKA